MKSWKTTIGGAFGVAGIALTGWTQYISPDDFTKEERKWISLAGLLMTIVGLFCTALFSASTAAVKELKELHEENVIKIKENIADIKENIADIKENKAAIITGDT